MSADILLILDGSCIAFLVAIHANAVQLRCQTGDAFNYLQVVIKDETAMLQNKDLEERLDSGVADVRSLQLIHARSFNIVHAGRHDCENDLLTHLADNLRTLTGSGFYPLQKKCIQTSGSNQSEISQLPVQTNRTQRNIHIKGLTCVSSN